MSGRDCYYGMDDLALIAWAADLGYREGLQVLV
jgi:hypothetical protein